MTSHDLAEYGAFTHWQAFIRTAAEQILNAAPAAGYGVFVLRTGVATECKRGSSDLAYIGAALDKGGLRARLGEYLLPPPLGKKHAIASNRAERLCGAESRFEMAWLPISSRAKAKKLQSDLIQRYRREHGEVPTDMPRRLALSRRLRPVMFLTRECLAVDELVYVLVADRPVKYKQGRSRIVYVGTTKRGAGRFAASAAENADRIFREYRLGVQRIEVYVVSSQLLPDVATWAELETACLMVFEMDYGPGFNGKGPICNDHNHGKAERKDVFRHFKEQSVRRLIHLLSDPLPQARAQRSFDGR